MNEFQSINDQVQTLFEQSNEPNMYLPEFDFYNSLQTIKPMSLPRQQSIKRMINFINIILYLKTNKHRPCQIKFHHVGCDKENNWGLKHVVCYRDIKSTKAKDTYDNSEFLYHIDQDNQLVWNLGKVWLRFYTDRKVTVIDKSQPEIDEVIDNSVTDELINKILKKMLKIKKDHRISFQKFIQNEVFSNENFHQTLYSSICLHFQMVSKNQKVMNSLNGKREIRTPYEEEIFRRQLQQSLDICTLLDKSIKNIRGAFQKSVEIQFHVFLIKAQAYCILKTLDEKKISNQIVDYTSQQKKIYSKFVTKMLTLKDELSRKMRMQIFTNGNGLHPDQKSFINSMSNNDNMVLTKIHPAFKEVLINYYLDSVEEIKRITNSNLPENIKRQKVCELEKVSLVFLLSRLCMTIFSQLRSQIFEEVVKRSNQSLKIFCLKDLLTLIDSAQEYSVLRRIRQKVLANGFKNNSGSSNPKIQTKNS